MTAPSDQESDISDQESASSDQESDTSDQESDISDQESDTSYQEPDTPDQQSNISPTVTASSDQESDTSSTMTVSSGPESCTPSDFIDKCLTMLDEISMGDETAAAKLQTQVQEMALLLVETRVAPYSLERAYEEKTAEGETLRMIHQRAES